MSYNIEAVEAILKKYGNSLMRVAFTYTNNMEDAQDVVQDVLLNYMTKAPIFDSSEHEKAWLIRVTINISKNYISSAYRRTKAELSENITVCDNYSTGLSDVVNSLPEKYRIVIHLFYYEGYSVKEISKIINITGSAVTTRLQRGREILKRRLGDDFFE